MRHQAFRYGTMMLSILLAAAVPARAGGIGFTEVMQAIANGSNGRPNAELRLRAVQQSGQLPGTSTTSSTTTTAPTGSQTGTASGTTVGSTTGSTTSIISAETVPQQEGTVETIELGDITGTICDCGPIIPLVGGGGFPLWPLFGLAAIPLAFLPGGDDEVPPFISPPTPTPTMPPNPIPEPATLLLFGSSLLALGAGARRRRAQEAMRHETAAIVKEV